MRLGTDDGLDCSQLPELMRLCHAHQAKYLRTQRKDNNEASGLPCLQLFRCAATLDDEEAEIAFANICAIFRPLVESWIRNHPNYWETGESIEWLVNFTYLNFYRQLRRPVFVERATHLGGVLTLFKMCVHASISEIIRTSPALPTEDDKQLERVPDTSDLEADLHWESLIDCLEAALSSPEDQLLAHLVFVQELKPAQIEQIYAKRWGDVRKRTYRIRERLRNNETFLDCVGANE